MLQKLVARMFIAITVPLLVAVVARVTFALLAPIMPLLVALAVVSFILTVILGRHRPR